MVISWIKWKLYIRWKGRWNNIPFLRSLKSKKIFYLSLVLLNIIKSLIIFYLSYLILNSFVNNPPFFMKNILQEHYMKSDSSMLFLILSFSFLIVTVYSFSVGYQSIYWQKFSKDRDWLKANGSFSDIFVSILLFIENIVWNLKTVLFVYVPIFIAIGSVYNKSFSFILGMIFLLILSFFMIGIVSALFTTSYIEWVIKLDNYYTKLVYIVITRVMIILFSFYLGKTMSSWIKQFPIENQNIKSSSLGNWIDLGINELAINISSVISLVFFEYLPHNLLANVISSNYSIFSVFKLLFMFITLITISLLLLKLTNNDESKLLKSIFMEAPLIKINKMLFFVTQTYRIKIFCRNDYVRRKYSYLFGPVIFWLLIGLVSGILIEMSSNQKLFYFVIAFYIFFPVYYLSHSVLRGLTGQFSLESDGNLIILYFLAKKSLWDVFKQKFNLYLFMTMPILIIGDLIFIILSNVSYGLGISILIIHIFAFIAFGFSLYTPSVVNPHFSYQHIQELDRYADKSWIDNLCSLLISGFIIPLLLTPIGLYLVDKINLRVLYYLQFGLSLSVLSFVIYVHYLLFRHKLQNIKTLDHLK
ncbi:hypothetical protein [Bacillus cereus]|uniref:hypothetical protein n=1 Tax=Bacillus cereus TaxID=1396 RepID=UPI0024BC9ECF|nr:hypothetical protein [Bacillus cereus]WHT85438.1 hypothetical protein QM225_000805 [Bacillus cereus]